MRLRAVKGLRRPRQYVLAVLRWHRIYYWVNRVSRLLFGWDAPVIADQALFDEYPPIHWLL